MTLTLTAKIRLYPTLEDIKAFNDTAEAYKQGCNHVSSFAFLNNIYNRRVLHDELYYKLRELFGLKSQMAASVIKTTLAKYKSAKANRHKCNLVIFKHKEYDLVYNRDYSVFNDYLSINTIAGRLKIKYNTKPFEHYFDGTWAYGTAKLVNKHKKWFLHIPFSKEVEQLNITDVDNVVGIDLGINFLATIYDSQGKSTFINGRQIKHKRAHYKQLRKELQQRQTSSARRRLKAIGNRENRWVTDINHQVSKALIAKYGKGTLFVIEDLTGIRNATEKVHIKHRYEIVSWSFYQLRLFLEYKAIKYGAKTITVDPRYTSQTCPICAHVEKTNRNKKTHTFCCKKCNYRSNDDRIAAMNLHNKGIEYLSRAI